MKKSALIPLLHLAQEQDGYVTNDAMAHIGELVGVTSAEVLGTCSFYEMFKLDPVGKYVVNVCTNISCQLVGGEELLHHAEKTLGIKSGNTTADGLFTLEDVECIAACTEAPCLQVNYRYRHRITHDEFDRWSTTCATAASTTRSRPRHPRPGPPVDPGRPPGRRGRARRRPPSRRWLHANETPAGRPRHRPRRP